MLCRFVRHPWKSCRPLCHVLCADDILTDWERKESCSWRILDLTKMFFIPHFRYVIREIRGSIGGLSTQDRLSFVVNLSGLLAHLPSYKKNSMLLRTWQRTHKNVMKFTHYLPPSSDEVTNEWSYTSAAPIRLPGLYMHYYTFTSYEHIRQPRLIKRCTGIVAQLLGFITVLIYNLIF
jgi:hypothetical protein